MIIWTIETFFNSIAGATWGYFSKYNSTFFLELLWGSLLVYASIKAVFHLLPYWIAYRFLSLPNKPIAHFVATQVGLFIFVSLIAGGIFAWNLFYNDLYLAVGMVISSAIAAFLFAYFEKKYDMSRV
ncbi:hypothetical protein [Hymenobacter terricola]|uniref:hypothetical protein n=1 Tax=Hymenobacter terricola TaxID=2819236 RepID=UPI001B300695|nr:hypothetical protein [Hymenobacter terricola]